MRVLITGITGFAGRHLAAYLSKKKGVRIFGTGHGVRRTSRITAVRGAQIFPCDIRDRSSVRRVVEKTRPECIFHLAAQASVPRSWELPAETFKTNVLGTLNLFEEVKRLKTRPRIHIAGSAQEYGDPGRSPVAEDGRLRPGSPYAVSKIAQELLSYQYDASAGIPVVRTRAFNHTGPGQTREYVVSALAFQIAEIEAGLRDPEVALGNLDSVRDFTDVRDVVRAYWLALEKGVPGEVYNVCSGVGRRIGDIVDYYSGRARVKFRVKKNTRQFRDHDTPVLLGRADKLRRRTGWRPQISFHTTLDEVLDHWRRNVQATSR